MQFEDVYPVQLFSFCGAKKRELGSFLRHNCIFIIIIKNKVIMTSNSNGDGKIQSLLAHEKKSLSTK